MKCPVKLAGQSLHADCVPPSSKMSHCPCSDVDGVFLEVWALVEARKDMSDISRISKGNDTW